MKKFLLLLLGILLFFTPISMVNAQITSCVVEPQPNMQNDPTCTYSTLNAQYSYYDSCYQQYLVRKNDWETKCLIYWGKQKLNQTPSATPQPQPTTPTQENTIIVTPTPIQQVNSKFIYQNNIKPTLVRIPNISSKSAMVSVNKVKTENKLIKVHTSLKFLGIFNIIFQVFHYFHL